MPLNERNVLVENVQVYQECSYLCFYTHLHVLFEYQVCELQFNTTFMKRACKSACTFSLVH